MVPRRTLALKLRNNGFKLTPILNPLLTFWFLSHAGESTVWCVFQNYGGVEVNVGRFCKRWRLCLSWCPCWEWLWFCFLMLLYEGLMRISGKKNALFHPLYEYAKRKRSIEKAWIDDCLMPISFKSWAFVDMPKCIFDLFVWFFLLYAQHCVTMKGLNVCLFTGEGFRDCKVCSVVV